jgi:hypothetical protein
VEEAGVETFFGMMMVDDGWPREDGVWRQGKALAMQCLHSSLSCKAKQSRAETISVAQREGGGRGSNTVTYDEGNAGWGLKSRGRD